MSSTIRLDAKLKKPLYQQLVEAITRNIEDGIFSPGERLPSVRDMAMDVRINPNTVARAYQELEKSAFVQSQPGRGVFVLSAVPAADLPVEIDAALTRLFEVARELEFPLEKLDGSFRRRLLAAIRQEDSQS